MSKETYIRGKRGLQLLGVPATPRAPGPWSKLGIGVLPARGLIRGLLPLCPCCQARHNQPPVLGTHQGHISNTLATH